MQSRESISRRAGIVLVIGSSGARQRQRCVELQRRREAVQHFCLTQGFVMKSPIKGLIQLQQQPRTKGLSPLLLVAVVMVSACITFSTYERQLSVYPAAELPHPPRTNVRLRYTVEGGAEGLGAGRSKDAKLSPRAFLHAQG